MHRLQLLLILDSEKGRLWCCLKHYHAFWLQVRHGAGTGLREILKFHGRGGGKLVGSTAEQVRQPFIWQFAIWSLAV